MIPTASRGLAMVLLCTSALLGCKQAAGEHCTASTECGAGLACDRFAGACAPTDEVLALERCKLAPPCQTDALCTPKADGCVTGSAEDCVQSALCIEDGRCSFEAGACVATSDADCRGSEACKQDGACTAKDGVCVEAAGEDVGAGEAKPATGKPRARRRSKKTTAWCQKSDYCKKYGKCTAKGKWCVAASDDDCRRSTICKQHGKCRARDGMCAD